MSRAMGSTLATRLGICLAWVITVWAAGSVLAADPHDSHVDSAHAALRQVVAEHSGWDKVHAGEFLLSLGYDQDEVCRVFQLEADANSDNPPYRIGVWRVLATGDCPPHGRDGWIARIRSIAFDNQAPDQLFAIETLCKLSYQPTPIEQEALRNYVTERPAAEAVYARWLLALVERDKQIDPIVSLLQHDQEMVRLRAGAVLGRLGPLTSAHWNQLAEAAKSEPTGSIARIHLAAAAWMAPPLLSDTADIESILVTSLNSDNVAEKKYAAMALAQRGDTQYLPLLLPLIEDDDPGVRAHASLAVLRTIRRIPKTIGLLDWAVIVAYGLSMLLIGWYFSRKTVSTEDFHLGGRSQKPWAVGLSLFATLLSTLSYMAYPGEMIKHGPMMAAGMLLYPVIFIIIGYGIIPLIMRQRVTSAYEILERRLGLGPRMFGSALFILMRLTWMAAVIHITSAVIIVPIMGIDPQWSPVVGVIIGGITLVYTSMGGLRAVIWTDVLQTFILFLGGLLTVILVSSHLNGFHWFPTQWAPHWDPLVIGFDPSARVTLLGVGMMSLGWYVCTAGSDQMAMQRYLATRDAPAARRMFGISLIATVLVTLLLMCIGFALLEYFRTHPAMMPDGQSIAQSADKLFPRFIVIAMPAGVAGLVIAGLLAAAMSSLSSGISSAGAVIQVDFLNRLMSRIIHPSSEVKLARWTSVAVGLTVVLMSLSIGQVKGNLLEVVNKVANLFTAPLFLLFFMALFIPWARGTATIIATIASIATAVAIAYFEVFGLSFLWILPASLSIGVLTGSVLSLVPLGPTARARMAISGPHHSADA